MTEKENCPRCGSEDYGQEEDGTMTCMSCKLGIPTGDGNGAYVAGYAYACGYHD